MSGLPDNVRREIERIVNATEDSTLSPLCHNASLDEICSKADPFEEVRVLIFVLAIRAAELAVKYERKWLTELVCEECGDAGDHPAHDIGTRRWKITRAEYERRNPPAP